MVLRAIQLEPQCEAWSYRGCGREWRAGKWEVGKAAHLILQDGRDFSGDVRHQWQGILNRIAIATKSAMEARVFADKSHGAKA